MSPDDAERWRGCGSIRSALHVTIYIYAQVKSRSTHGVVGLSKRVWVRIDRYNPQLTLREVYDKISEIQKENPDLDVFFDGDEFAICSRPRSDPPPPSTLEDE